MEFGKVDTIKPIQLNILDVPACTGRFDACRGFSQLKNFPRCQSFGKKVPVHFPSAGTLPAGSEVPRGARLFSHLSRSGSSPRCQVSHNAPGGISFEHHARLSPKTAMLSLHRFRRAAVSRRERTGAAAPNPSVRSSLNKQLTRMCDVAPPPPRPDTPHDAFPKLN